MAFSSMSDPCGGTRFWYDDDIALCDQNLVLGTVRVVLLAAALLWGLCTARRRPKGYARVNTSPEDEDDDVGLVQELDGPEGGPAQTNWSTVAMACLSVVVVAAYGALVLLPVARGKPVQVKPYYTFVGDVMSLAAWAAVVVDAGVHACCRRRLGLGLRLWLVVELLCALMRARTEIDVLAGAKPAYEDDEGATWIRTLLAIPVLLMAAIALVEPRGPRGGLYDPRSAIPPDGAGAEPEGTAVTVESGTRRSGEGVASMLSYLVVGWVNPLLKAGSKVPLQQKMLFDLLGHDSPAVNAHRVRAMLQQELAANKKPSLWWIMFRMYAGIWWTSGLCLLGSTLMGFTAPILLNRMILYLENPSMTLTYGCILAAGIFAQSLVSGALQYHCDLMMSRMGMRSRSALTSLVYGKALRLAQPARVQFSDGQILNLMQVDSMRLANSVSVLHDCWVIPVTFVLCLYFLYQQIGFACFGAIFVMLLLSPANYLVMKIYLKYSRQTMERRDKRVKLLTEILEGIKIVKYFGWEHKMQARIQEARDDEVASIRINQYTISSAMFMWTVCPTMISVMSFGLFTWFGGQLTVAKAFTSISLFNILEAPVSLGPMIIQYMLELRISMTRLMDFMLADELHTHNSTNFPDDAPDGSYCRAPHGQQGFMVWIKDGSFRWREGKVGKEEQKTKKQSQIAKLQTRMKALTGAELEEVQGQVAALEEEVKEIDQQLEKCGDSLLLPIEGPPTIRNINLKVMSGTITCIVGKVGSGKSTVLSALLNEVSCESGRVFLGGKVAYCAQQPWITNATLRDNILWGEPYHEDRYKRAVWSCALEEDLKQMAGGQGDLTEIGEKGLNLSGGQKARIALARAVYADADVYLLDDVLSAVDPHVAAHLMEQCIRGVLHSKTRVLVTHHPRWLPVMDHIVAMEDGAIAMAGTYAEVVEQGLHAEDIKEEEEEKKEEGEGIDDAIGDVLDTLHPELSLPSEDLQGSFSRSLSAQSSGAASAKRARGASKGPRKAEEEEGPAQGRIVKDEDRETGAVALTIWALYVKTIGVPLFGFVLFLFIVVASGQVFGNWFLQYWSQQIKSPTNTHSSFYYLGIYGGILGGCAVIVYLRAITFVVASLRLARRIHDAAFWAVLRSPMAYFDTTIKGRITNRFSTDQQKVDLWLRGVMGYLMNTSIQGAASLLVVTITAPHVSVTFLFLAIFYVHAMNYFRRSNRELQRLDSQGASPLYGHFGETLSGVSTIRGFGAERNMREKNLQMLGGACGPSFYQAVLGCWLKIRLQMVASVIILGVAVVAVMAHSAGKENAALAGTLGLSLSYALNLTTHLSGIIFGFTTAETSLVALERLNAFALLPPEPPLALESDPQTEEWPTAGKVEFKKVVMQYREGLDPVLKGLSFKVAPGEKVGIVGRTGAGKSSLLVTLLRLVELKDGQIRIDGRPTSSVGLHALRCRIAIIPQEPVLFSGTLRFNLDPFERHTSDKLWATLADAKLKEFVESRSGGLDMTIEPNGQNLSVGQRQLVCMVRALLCDCKILLLDEATASVDHHTDRLIQATLRDLKGVTTLTIAHRINTILESDRVLVMDDGKAIEFDNPQALIARPGSVFGDIVAQYQADHDASNSSPRSP